MGICEHQRVVLKQAYGLHCESVIVTREGVPASCHGVLLVGASQTQRRGSFVDFVVAVVPRM